MGQEEVPGHVEAGGDGRAEQEGGGLEQGGAEAASINLRKNLDGTKAILLAFLFAFMRLLGGGPVRAAPMRQPRACTGHRGSRPLYESHVHSTTAGPCIADRCWLQCTGLLQANGL